MSISSEITRLQNAKASIKTSIEAKGVTVPSSAKLDSYSSYVDQIQTGGGSSKIASVLEGTVTTMNASDFEGATAIKQSCFEGITTLTSVTVPSSVTSVGSWAFKGCTNLTSITFQGSISAWATAGAGYGHNGVFQSAGLTSFTFPPVPTGQTSIGYLTNMFRYCASLQTVDLRNLNVEILGTSGTTGKPDNMFNECTNLTTVLMPQAISKKFYNATGVFDKCEGLTTITLPPIIETGTIQMGQYFFRNCKALTSITIPSSISSFSSSCFESCTALTSVTFPATVTTGQYFGNSTFNGCTSLNNVVVPEGVTHLPNSVFYNCDALTNLTLPSTLTNIVQTALARCNNLTELTFNGTMAQWNSVTKGSGWMSGTPLATIHCSDGDITL